MSGAVILGLCVCVGLPLVVFFGAIFWPTRIPKGRSVAEIQRRIEEERGQ